MNSANDLDTLLTGPDDHDMPAADAFVDAVMAGIGRRLRYRRIVLAAIGAAVLLVMCVAMVALPVPAMSGAPGGPFDMVALLVLGASCSLGWVATEDTRLPHP